jgi:hypothetical protein
MTHVVDLMYPSRTVFARTDIAQRRVDLVFGSTKAVRTSGEPPGGGEADRASNGCARERGHHPFGCPAALLADDRARNYRPAA